MKWHKASLRRICNPVVWYAYRLSAWLFLLLHGYDREQGAPFFVRQDCKSSGTGKYAACGMFRVRIKKGMFGFS